MLEETQIRTVNQLSLEIGNYGCNASSLNGYVYKDVFINVLDVPPEIITSPQPNLRAVTGSTVKMTCETFGAPKPIVKWYHGQDEVNDGNRYNINITNDGSMINKDVSIYDDGEYLCTATNKYGNVHAKGRLTVLRNTRITKVTLTFNKYIRYMASDSI